MFTWRCTKCDRKNWAHQDFCAGCGSPKPATVPALANLIFTFFFIFLTPFALVGEGGLSAANAHDYKRPDLNNWYGSLQATGKGTLPRGTSCCSKEDCHVTEAEIRNGEWWARIGYPTHTADGNQDWELGDWVKIPDEIIVRGPNGNAARNEAGEAVICHPVVWQNSGLDVSHTPIYCFVPGNET